MPPGKLPAGPRSDSSPYHSIPLVLIARLLTVVSPLGGPVPAGRLVVAPRGGPIGLLRKPMVGERPHLGGSGDGSVSSCVRRSGAGDGVRTRDPLLGKQMLYH